MQRRIVFDLDHTICIPHLEFFDIKRRYAQATPIKKMIEIMQKLHKKEFYIIIYTARGMLSCNGNPHMACGKNVDVAKKWLNDNNVPYDELVFGKPYAEFYVDDKMLSFHDVELLCK